MSTHKHTNSCSAPEKYVCTRHLCKGEFIICAHKYSLELCIRCSHHIMSLYWNFLRYIFLCVIIHHVRSATNNAGTAIQTMQPAKHVHGNLVRTYRVDQRAPQPGSIVVTCASTWKPSNSLSIQFLQAQLLVFDKPAGCLWSKAGSSSHFVAVDQI